MNTDYEIENKKYPLTVVTTDIFKYEGKNTNRLRFIVLVAIYILVIPISLKGYIYNIAFEEDYQPENVSVDPFDNYEADLFFF